MPRRLFHNGEVPRNLELGKLFENVGNMLQCWENDNGVTGFQRIKPQRMLLVTDPRTRGAIRNAPAPQSVTCNSCLAF